jgi:hypothetical protein
MITVFLLLCQIQGGELVHCSPPHAVTGHRYSQVQWQSEWKSWDECIKEADRRNGRSAPPRGGVEGRQGWRFFCYPTNAVEGKPSPAPAR